MVENIKILIVEDSATQAARLEYILEKNNYKVVIAENGVEALDIIKDKQPDLVITDIIMPEMDGFELCEKIREDEKLAELPVIMLTQLSKPEDVTKGLKCGANDFIIKPYNGKLLTIHVKKIISIKNYQKYIKEKVKILIVEDSLTQAESLKHLFENQGYKITIATNGDEAINLLEKESPSLIISDIIMQPIDGYELCKRIKKMDKFKDIPIILLTSLTEPLDIIHGVESKADYYFTKPYDEDYLISKVETLLAIPLLQQKYNDEERIKISSIEEKYLLTSDNRQIIKLLLSTYENSVYQNRQLLKSKIELQQLNNQLEDLVKKRTEKLVIEITERKKTQKALQKSHNHLEDTVDKRTKQLQKANLKLQELGRLKSMFIASMSHELRTPLNSIIGFTGIILQGMSGEITGDQRKELTMVKNSANHLLALINDVIDVSKIERGKVELFIEDFNLADLMQGAMESFKVAVDEKNIKLSLKMPERLIIKGDERRTKQVIMNLMSNALKFTDRGEVEIKVRKEDKRVEVSVTDTGIGIRKENMEKLFKQFSRIYAEGKPITEGTGLGLYLSKKIVNLLGGQLKAESEFGKGSMFTFTFPLEYKEVKV